MARLPFRSQHYRLEGPPEPGRRYPRQDPHGVRPPPTIIAPLATRSAPYGDFFGARGAEGEKGTGRRQRLFARLALGGGSTQADFSHWFGCCRQRSTSFYPGRRRRPPAPKSPSR